jgi:hypothetical protein
MSADPFFPQAVGISPDLARFLLGELPPCEGVGPFGCEADGPAPAIVFVDGLWRHLCDRCASGVEDAEGRVDAPHASFVRVLQKLVASARTERQ